jgi:hypothetical protein
VAPFQDEAYKEMVAAFAEVGDEPEGDPSPSPG